MDIRNKANRIRLLNFSTPQMRAFHLSWFAFHICFFGWFGIAPLMAVVREDLSLTQAKSAIPLLLGGDHRGGAPVDWRAV